MHRPIRIIPEDSKEFFIALQQIDSYEMDYLFIKKKHPKRLHSNARWKPRRKPDLEFVISAETTLSQLEI